MKTHSKIAVVGMLCAAACASLAAGENVPAAGMATADSNWVTAHQERLARKAKRIEERGGWVEIAPSGSVVRVISAQSRVSHNDLKQSIDVFRQALQLPVEWLDDASGTQDPAKLAATSNSDGKCAVAVVFVDDQSAPRMLVAPENGWASINLARLADGNPSHDQLVRRARQEYWRAACMVLGAYVSMQQPCVMTLITGNADLDANPCVIPEVEVLPKVSSMARKLGIRPGRRVVYERACEQGWAPAPTNDVQKAIWDKVHAMPTEPIKIKPEEKKTEK